MTQIEELLARKKELLHQKKEELALQEAGQGDNLALFIVEEELMSVNAQLRELMPRHRVAARRVGGAVAVDRKIAQDWFREQDNFDEELEERHRIYLQTVRELAGGLTARQKELFSMWQAGKTMEQIGREAGISKSTASRTVLRAKRKLQEEAGLRLKFQNIDAARFDLSDPQIASAVLACLTNTQAIYIYLYYGEWLSLREVARLLGVEHTSVWYAIGTGLAAIGRHLHCKEILLDNVDALDDLMYQIYLERGVQEEAEAPAADHYGWGRATIERHQPGYWKKRWGEIRTVQVMVRTSYGEEDRYGNGGHGEHHARQPGRLLRALLERLQALGPAGRDFPLRRWLRQLFAHVTRRKKQ